MTKQTHQPYRQPTQTQAAAKPQGSIQTRPQHAPKPQAPRPQAPKPQPPQPQELKPHPPKVPGIPRHSSQRPAPKTAITKEDVKRIQRITALDNDGHQADWTKRLQSIADKRDAQAKLTPEPSGAGQGRGKASSGKKAA